MAGEIVLLTLWRPTLGREMAMTRLLPDLPQIPLPMTPSTERVPLGPRPGRRGGTPREAASSWTATCAAGSARNLGLWRSRRLYFFRGEEEALRLDLLLRIETYEQPVEGEAAYRISWTPETGLRLL